MSGSLRDRNIGEVFVEVLQKTMQGREMSIQAESMSGVRIALFSNVTARYAAAEANEEIAGIEARGDEVLDLRWEVTPMDGNNTKYTVCVIYRENPFARDEEEA